MELGNKIRMLRHRRGLTITELAEKAGVSPSLISQIERDKICPSVYSVWEISKALNVSIGYFFNDHQTNNNPVVRKDERKKLVLGNSSAIYELLSPNLSGKIEFLRIVIEPGECTDQKQISHEGEECGIVLQGKLLVKWGDEEYILNEGDSIYFASTVPHRYINIGDVTSISIWAMTPPSF